MMFGLIQREALGIQVRELAYFLLYILSARWLFGQSGTVVKDISIWAHTTLLVMVVTFSEVVLS